MTLQQAHDMLRRLRPDVRASAARWQAFHERAAEVFGTVAKLDGDHHFEALALAAIAKEDAEKCGGQASADSSRKPVIGPSTA